jgi:hypothetical protein
MANESKYDKAVDHARNKGNGETALAPIGEVKAMISTFTAEEIAKEAATGAYEFAPQNISLEPGQKISGILEGMGPGNDFVDEDTGVVRHVDSWVIASPDKSLRVSILSSAQLDKKLPPFAGGLVHIARQNDIKLAGGHRCADYMVWGPKLAKGESRKFHSPAKAIEATGVETKALPAGDVQAAPAGNHATTPTA